jgi:hypothetical protein
MRASYLIAPTQSHDAKKSKRSDESKRLWCGRNTKSERQSLVGRLFIYPSTEEQVITVGEKREFLFAARKEAW